MKTTFFHQLLFILQIWLNSALPIVDPGLFVIMGVSTCRSGEGYCLLGLDCTLDEDFLPDDLEGHCDGLRSAFTPSAHFICCKYNAENATTATPTTTTTAHTVSLVTPYTRDRPADGALVNILKDYLDTNEEPFVPMKPELVANNYLPATHEDIEVIAEPIQSSEDDVSMKQEAANKDQEIVRISDPIDIDKITDIPVSALINQRKPQTPDLRKGDHTEKITDVKDLIMFSSVDEDQEKGMDISPSDVYKSNTQAPSKAPLGATKHKIADAGKQPVIKGQITRVNAHGQHSTLLSTSDREIQEAVLETMIPVKIVDFNDHGSSKNVNIRRTSGSPAVRVTVAADSPHLEQINVIPRSLWR